MTQYEVLNDETDDSHGLYDTLDQAYGCVEFDRLYRGGYTIYRGRMVGEEFIAEERVASYCPAEPV